MHDKCHDKGRQQKAHHTKEPCHHATRQSGHAQGCKADPGCDEQQHVHDLAEPAEAHPLARMLSGRRVLTPRGSMRWTHTTVVRVLARAI